MAPLAVLFTLIFLVLTVSHARLIKQKETVINLSKSDLTTTDVLDLPSDKSNSKPVNVVDYKYDYVTEVDSEPDKIVDYKHDDVMEVDSEPVKVVDKHDDVTETDSEPAKIIDYKHDDVTEVDSESTKVDDYKHDDVTEVDSESAKVADYKHDDVTEAELELDSFPLTMSSFRPVNGHFPRHPLIPFRHKHNCRQHKKLRPLNMQFQRKRYISYDNDMILSDERSRSDSESASQIQSRWDGFFDNDTESNEHVNTNDHENEQDHDSDVDTVDTVDTYDHEHEQDHDGDRYHDHRGEEDERHDSEEQDGGFMERFRKFLINF